MYIAVFEFVAIAAQATFGLKPNNRAYCAPRTFATRITIIIYKQTYTHTKHR